MTLSQAIKSLSILTILMDPLEELLFCIPQIFTALGCFARVQDYLESDSWTDFRIHTASRTTTGTASMTATQQGASIEMQPREGNGYRNYIFVRNASFGWTSSSPTLRDVSVHLTQEINVTMVLGPVGCGKSTFLKSLLGETITQSGSVTLSTSDISYCDQAPWLSIGTVRSVILGTSDYCEWLYQRILHACALDVDMALLKNGDSTRIDTQDGTLSGGQKQRVAIARALFSKKPIAFFDDVLSGLDAVTQDIVFTRVFGPNGMIRELGIMAILATHSTNRLDVTDYVVVLDDQGCIAQQGRPETVARMALMAGRFGQSEVASQAAPASNGAYAEQIEAEEHPPDRQIGDLSIYKYYFASLGWLNVLLFAMLVACEGAFMAMQSIWITLWSSSPDKNNTEYWLGIYALWPVLTIVSIGTAVYFLYVVIVPKSATRLHRYVLEAVFRAPTSFISETPTGVFVNSFSQDMQLVDMALPGALSKTCFVMSECAVTAVLALVASPYIAVILPIFLGLIYILQNFYLKTSRQLRLLELESKAPLFSHVIDTVNGLISIRAYGWGGEYVNKCAQLLGECQKPFYLLLCIQRWLGVVLGLTVAVFAVLLTTLAVTLRGSSTNARFVGVALVNMMRLSQSLAQLILSWTSLETSLGAVSRVKKFSETTPQEAEPDGEVPDEWPTRGELCFHNWTTGYRESTVLHGITMSVQHGQKVAICGRTGSGKSSLITSILRMVDGMAGRILVDKVDLSTIPGETIREAITCVTQDPFLFGGSVRLNLDPMAKKEDREIEAVLQKCGLLSIIRRVVEINGEGAEKALDITTDELHLSRGQLQLFSLARAMLRSSPILLLDELTSR